MDAAARSAVWGGATIGFALSGIVDVAVFHNLLQWHHFVVSGDPAAELRSDGWLLLVLGAVSFAGVLLLWRGARADAAAGRRAWGGALVGAGAFNGGDILLDHFVLGLHRLHGDAPSLAGETAWLGLSVLLVAAGLVVLRRAERVAATPRPARS